MANIKSAKKRILVTKKETILNNDVRSSMKTAIKKVEKAETKDEALKVLPEAIKRIDNVIVKLIIKSFGSSFIWFSFIKAFLFLSRMPKGETVNI